MAGATGLILSFLAGVMVGRGVEGSARARSRPRARRARSASSPRSRPATPTPRRRGLQLRAAAGVRQARGGAREDERRGRHAGGGASRVADRRGRAQPGADAASRPDAATRRDTCRHDAPRRPSRRRPRRRRSRRTRPLPRRSRTTAGRLHDPGRRVQGQGERRLRGDAASRARASPAYTVAPAATSGGLFNVRVGHLPRPRRRRARAGAACATEKFKPYIIKHSVRVLTLLRLPAWARKGSRSRRARARCACCCARSALNTVCEEARCPNLGECFSRGTATFMLLGDRCTRRCGYCSVGTAQPAAPGPRRSPSAWPKPPSRLGLRYVVLTSVARDDLADGGAAHFAATVEAVARAPAAGGRSRC